MTDLRTLEIALSSRGEYLRCARGLTYVISDGEYLKVGRAKDLAVRLSSLQGGNPRRLRIYSFVSRDIERDVHQALRYDGRYQRYWVIGSEWYFDVREIRDELARFGLTELGDVTSPAYAEVLR
jgi:hypothetical protein